MSKKKQSRTKSNTKNSIEENKFFPDVLRGKKLKKEGWLGKTNELLEQYLQTEDPEFLFKAIAEDFSILQGAAKNLNTDSDVKYIDGYTITWQSIYHWQGICLDWIMIYWENGELDALEEPEIKVKEKYSKQKLALDAENLLKKIGNSLLIQFDDGNICTTDGLTHITNKYQHGSRKLTYDNAENFLNDFEVIRDVFSKTISRKGHLSRKPDELILSEVSNAVDKLGSKLSEDDINTFLDLVKEDVFTYTIRYIRLVHKKLCKVCLAKDVSDMTIRRIYTDAKKEITSNLNN